MRRRRSSAAVAGASASAWITAATLAGQATVGVPGSRQPRPPSAARITPLPEAEWTAEQRALVAKVAPKGDADSALRTLVRVPALVQGVMPYTAYLTTDSTLPPRVRHLLILRTAWLCGNDVLWSRYASGLTADERRRVAQGPSAAGWSDGRQGTAPHGRRAVPAVVVVGGDVGRRSLLPTTCTASWTSSRP